MAQKLYTINISVLSQEEIVFQIKGLIEELNLMRQISEES